MNEINNCSDGVVLMHKGLDLMRCTFVKAVDGKIIPAILCMHYIFPFCRYLC